MVMPAERASAETLALGSVLLQLRDSPFQARNSHMRRAKLKALIPVKAHASGRHDP